MKTLIVYAGKHGATEEMTRIIREELGEHAVLANLLLDRNVDPADYDCVIAGGAVFAGRVHKSVRRFCESHEQTLLSRPLGLYLVSLREEELEETFDRSFPASLREHAVAERWLGGRVIFSHYNPLLRRMLKKIMNREEDVENLRPEEAQALAAELRAGAAQQV